MGDPAMTHHYRFQAFDGDAIMERVARLHRVAAEKQAQLEEDESEQARRLVLPPEPDEVEFERLQRNLGVEEQDELDAHRDQFPDERIYPLPDKFFPGEECTCNGVNNPNGCPACTSESDLDQVLPY